MYKLIATKVGGSIEQRFQKDNSSGLFDKMGYLESLGYSCQVVAV